MESVAWAAGAQTEVLDYGRSPLFQRVPSVHTRVGALDSVLYLNLKKQNIKTEKK